MKEMTRNDANLSVITAHQLFTLISNQEHMTYVLTSLFRIKSLVVLERIDAHTIDTAKLDADQKDMLMFMLVLVKLQDHASEAKDILATQLNNKYSRDDIEKDKKAVLAVIKILLSREKELLQTKKSRMIE